MSSTPAGRTTENGQVRLTGTDLAIMRQPNPSSLYVLSAELASECADGCGDLGGGYYSRAGNVRTGL